MLNPLGKRRSPLAGADALGAPDGVTDDPVAGSDDGAGADTAGAPDGVTDDPVLGPVDGGVGEVETGVAFGPGTIPGAGTG